uniref:Uncharacterized protein n=1 Tax=Chromera velia CCMP2878 TaxID=1169474 RepID=A0A0G4HZC3_9ALVE|eukprot:Cvel_9660.t1-p1 / transcript=Cvel_9660.t1 / gene=Cvel_9660 / organism=Chromera_velia_CCMP2878 / gene_product=hypothetical protein / transcript_product=hypothetical protein / location=Cvel_scaffold562:57458-61572(+) / protein_length=935 / sequence_SO=supercontig / SO=protein_coding / is_pseudo=false
MSRQGVQMRGGSDFHALPTERGEYFQTGGLSGIPSDAHLKLMARTQVSTWQKESAEQRERERQRGQTKSQRSLQGLWYSSAASSASSSLLLFGEEQTQSLGPYDEFSGFPYDDDVPTQTLVSVPFSHSELHPMNSGSSSEPFRYPEDDTPVPLLDLSAIPIPNLDLLETTTTATSPRTILVDPPGMGHYHPYRVSDSVDILPHASAPRGERGARGGAMKAGRSLRVITNGGGPSWSPSASEFQQGQRSLPRVSPVGSAAGLHTPSLFQQEPSSAGVSTRKGGRKGFAASVASSTRVTRRSSLRSAGLGPGTQSSLSLSLPAEEDEDRLLAPPAMQALSSPQRTASGSRRSAGGAWGGSSSSSHADLPVGASERGLDTEERRHLSLPVSPQSGVDVEMVGEVEGSEGNPDNDDGGEGGEENGDGDRDGGGLERDAEGMPVFYEGVKLPLGETGRCQLKTLIGERMKNDAEIRLQVQAIAKLKCATIPQLLLMANICGLWEIAVTISDKFERQKQRTGSGRDICGGRKGMKGRKKRTGFALCSHPSFKTTPPHPDDVSPCGEVRRVPREEGEETEVPSTSASSGAGVSGSSPETGPASASASAPSGSPPVSPDRDALMSTNAGGSAAACASSEETLAGASEETGRMGEGEGEDFPFGIPSPSPVEPEEYGPPPKKLPPPQLDTSICLPLPAPAANGQEIPMVTPPATSKQRPLLSSRSGASTLCPLSASHAASHLSSTGSLTPPSLSSPSNSHIEGVAPHPHRVSLKRPSPPVPPQAPSASDPHSPFPQQDPGDSNGDWGLPPVFSEELTQRPQKNPRLFASQREHQQGGGGLLQLPPHPTFTYPPSSPHFRGRGEEGTSRVSLHHPEQEQRTGLGGTFSGDGMQQEGSQVSPLQPSALPVPAAGPDEAMGDDETDEMSILEIKRGTTALSSFDMRE